LLSIIISEYCHCVGHSPVYQIILKTCGSIYINDSIPLLIRSPGMLSAEATFIPFINALIANTTSSFGNGEIIIIYEVWNINHLWVSCGRIVVELFTAVSPSLCNVTWLCETFSILVCTGSRLLLFGKVFHNIDFLCCYSYQTALFAILSNQICYCFPLVFLFFSYSCLFLCPCCLPGDFEVFSGSTQISNIFGNAGSFS